MKKYFGLSSHPLEWSLFGLKSLSIISKQISYKKTTLIGQKCTNILQRKQKDSFYIDSDNLYFNGTNQIFLKPTFLISILSTLNIVN